MTKSEIEWSDLIEVYRNSVWGAGDEVKLYIANSSILETVLLVERSTSAAEASDITFLGQLADLLVGATVSARIGYPQFKIGILSRDWDSFLASAERRIEAPKNFYITSDGSSSASDTGPEAVIKYKAILKFVKILSEAALFTDVRDAKMVFFVESRIDIPIRFSERDFRTLDTNAINSLSSTLSSEIHREQRLTILGQVVASLVIGQTSHGRFVYLLQNVDEIANQLDDGYKLFASSFTYSKIRNEIEKNQSEYVTRVHKTFTDIQGQLLGLPVSAIIVATQIKSTVSCGVEVISNLGILLGACLFVVLLGLSCLNQWQTLSAIRQEVKAQRSKLDSDFSEFKDLFTRSFEAIEGRILWHRVVILAVSIFSLLGAAFTWKAYSLATKVSAVSCLLPSGSI